MASAAGGLRDLRRRWVWLGLGGLLLLLAGCRPSRELIPPTASTTPAQELPLLLSSDSPAFEQRWMAASEGEATLEVVASAPGSDWSRSGAEAATLTVYLDGDYRGDLVLYAGARSHRYTLLLGPVEAGPHRLWLQYTAEKSAPNARQVVLEAVRPRLYPPNHPRYAVLQQAPILYGRLGSRFTDIPLLVAYQTMERGAQRVITYTVVFSNEDEGTPPEGLMARWGRLTDIEWVYQVALDAGGRPVAAFYQGKDHKTRPFQGRREGMHPILRVATGNNMVQDWGHSPYRFAPVPQIPLPADHSREGMMDRFPWTYRVMAEEWAREGQERPTDPSTLRPGDPRDFLYVEFLVAGDCPRGAWSVQLRGEATWYRSDHGQDDLRVRLKGWHRAAVELPPGTRADQVTRLRFQVFPEEPGDPPCRLTLVRVPLVFLLEPDYRPSPTLFTLDTPVSLDTDPATATPDEIVFP